MEVDHCLKIGTYAQANDVTAEVELSLFDDMDGPCLLLLYLHNNISAEDTIH